MTIRNILKDVILTTVPTQARLAPEMPAEQTSSLPQPAFPGALPGEQNGCISKEKIEKILNGVLL